jgi:hypothetical protein
MRTEEIGARCEDLIRRRKPMEANYKVLNFGMCSLIINGFIHLG